MRRLVLGLVTAAFGLSLGTAAALAGSRNPDGYGIYTPGPRLPDGRRLWRYDERSWYHADRGYYPYFNSGYWVPRREMKTRYRYRYLGPRYKYFPAWGY